ncbi:MULTISPECIES: nuclear transport factor 2 family protein [unclassified Microbacterium]|uniref:nuclear transport factor 2 family protein n=1 Tax=unclassified Microbacterium TaxID=2609290 RepID=UPI003746944C
MTDNSLTPPAEPIDDERMLRAVPLLWASALDTGDTSVLAGLLTEDVVVDLTPATTKIGLDFPVLSGRETVIPAMIGAVGPLDTMHLVSNVFVAAQGDGYRIEAYAQAQHFLPGEGPDPLSTRHALMGNRWTFLIRRSDTGPRVAHFEMDCVWFEGDPSVLLAAVSA